MNIFKRTVVVIHKLDPKDRDLLQSVEMHLVAVFDELQTLKVDMDEQTKLRDELLWELENGRDGIQTA